MAAPVIWLSISAYARTYHVDRKTVYKWLDAGLLETFRVDKVIRIANHPPVSPAFPQSRVKGS